MYTVLCSVGVVLLLAPGKDEAQEANIESGDQLLPVHSQSEGKIVCFESFQKLYYFYIFQYII